MASPPSTAQKSLDQHPAGYLYWSRDPAVGLFAVLPLWLGYELLRLIFVPDGVNGAEWMLLGLMYRLPWTAQMVLHCSFGVLVLFSALSIVRRDIPWLRVSLVSVLEGLVYALLLGPLAVILTGYSLQVLAAVPQQHDLTAQLVASIGAGLFEEFVFRLLLLSLLCWLFMRCSKAFALPRYLGLGLAVLLSALLFSLFHHVGQGVEHLDSKVFLFRTMAGVILGLLFIFRGIGICIYTHAIYDLQFFLGQS